MAFLNDISKLCATADGCRLDVHGNLKLAGTVLVADLVSVRDTHFKGVRSLGDVGSRGHSATLSAEAARGLGSDESTSAILGRPAHFPQECHHT